MLAGFGLTCVAAPCDGRAAAARLTGAGLLAFAASHALGHLVGAWPAVFVVIAAGFQ